MRNLERLLVTDPLEVLDPHGIHKPMKKGEYLTVYSRTPPVLVRESDGRLTVTIMLDGGHRVIAPLGDGSYFFDRVTELMLIPALQQLGPVHVPYRTPVEDQDV